MIEVNVSKLKKKTDRSVDDLPSTCEKLHCSKSAEHGALFIDPAEWVAYCDECFSSLADTDDGPSPVLWDNL